MTREPEHEQRRENREARATSYYIVVSARRTTGYSALIVLIAVAGAIAWGACPQSIVAAQTVRSQRRGEDPLERFRSPEPLPVPLVAGESAWRLTLPVPPSAGGAIDDAHVYIPLRDTGIVALDRERGTQAWFRGVASSFAPVVGNGLVFAATTVGIEAFDAERGGHRWSLPLEQAVIAPLVWDSGWLIALLEPDQVIGIRATDGIEIWRSSIDGRPAHPPAIGGEAGLFFVLVDGRIVALSLADGKRIWERELPGTLSQPAASRDRVFIGSTDNSFTALDAETGEISWRWTRGGGDVIGAATDGEVVYFASLDNIIRAVNEGNGNQRWKKETGTRPVLPPSEVGGAVIVPGLTPAMAVFVAKTGVPMGSYVAQGNLLGPPLIDPEPKAFRVTFVTITREGVVEASRSAGLLFREPPLVGFTPPLPGRLLARERLD